MQMAKTWKGRVLGVFLSIVLVVGLMPSIALAEDSGRQGGEASVAAADTAATGDNGTATDETADDVAAAAGESAAENQVLAASAEGAATVGSLSQDDATAAEALPYISYLDENGTRQYLSSDEYNVVDDQNFTWSGDSKGGWYVVDKDITVTQGYAVFGDVKLILLDGCTLNATGSGNQAGIQVASYESKYDNFYGRLTVYAGGAGPAIAGSGTINAKGGTDAAGIGGTGGGNTHDITGSHITINGGIVNAAGSEHGAGIGGGLCADGFDITINGGTVTATGGYQAAGIGGGYGGDPIVLYNTYGAVGHDITINGGTVTATGGMCAAGIGGGCWGEAHDIAINGGTVTAVGGKDGINGIGGGAFRGRSGISIADHLIVMVGSSKESAKSVSEASNRADATAGAHYVAIGPSGSIAAATINYLDEVGSIETIAWWEGYNVVDDQTFDWDGGSAEGWYVVNKDITATQGYTVSGHVKLILLDGCTLNVTGASDRAGIDVSGAGNSLTVYVGGMDGVAGTGALNAKGGSCAAGIGGSYKANGSNIAIYGGKVTAKGGSMGAGIGGGYYGDGSNIAIYGGTVDASGGYKRGFSGYDSYGGAGIGGGSFGAGRNIAINGGTVTADAGYITYGCSGIGNGSDCDDDASNITVSTLLAVTAGLNSTSAEAVENTGSDLAGTLAGELWVAIAPDADVRDADAAGAGSDKSGKTDESSAGYSAAADGDDSAASVKSATASSDAKAADRASSATASNGSTIAATGDATAPSLVGLGIIAAAAAVVALAAMRRRDTQ